ncbi:malto-oligosyltrehalose trehalohydrolase [Devriesea agamarum]|uniref:malto-oligosyltrehalose trehalohydrolase n=1 Tax=Devriesea agamarum TaxID=472569 RepID=UPI00071C3687|nr:malto-oligosyltrehalose trehalohydrolase [Devriesea agamarum]
MRATPRQYSLFEVWAPSASACTIQVNGCKYPMAAEEGGWYRWRERPARPGDRYGFLLDSSPDSTDRPLPDPRSLAQPDGVHGLSEVVDPGTFTWTADWMGKDLRGAVLYELHIGTFTPEGTFDAAIDQLPYLVDLGIDAVEVMPIASFPGQRGWGYDGVDLFSAYAPYGGPTGFARFVDACHRHGLAVVLDVVYNHLGPAGNYLGKFGPYLTDKHETPWGRAINLDDDGCHEVRAFLIANARQWLIDFRCDGLRLDAVHELRDDSSRHILAELSDTVATWEQDLGRPLTLIAESDQNQPRTITPTAGGGLGMDAQWADDVHHAVHAVLTGERQGYYCDFGSLTTLAKALTRVFIHDGNFSTFRGRTWGEPVDPTSSDYDGHSFVVSLQNHDQVGNRAAGDRIHHGISPGLHAIGAALILCSPFTPMLFMGEEWACSSPFCFFSDHDADLGPLVSQGRTQEFSAMGWDDAVPDPQLASTFHASSLNWSQRDEAGHARMLDWYRTLIALRRREPELRDPLLQSISVQTMGEHGLVVRRGGITLLCALGPAGSSCEFEMEPAAGDALEVLATFTPASPPTLSAQHLRLEAPSVAIIRGDTPRRKADAAI